MEQTNELSKLFVYGIFLGETMRDAYNMKNPKYATVPGYVTVGEHIVQAVPVEGYRIALTGLLVDADPTKWSRLDALEAGYDRIKVKTDMGEEAWMYAARQSKTH